MPWSKSVLIGKKKECQAGLTEGVWVLGSLAAVVTVEGRIVTTPGAEKY